MKDCTPGGSLLKAVGCYNGVSNTGIVFMALVCRYCPTMNDWQRAEQHADRALEFFDRGRLAEAEHELREALRINPDQPDWEFNLGLTLEASDRDPEALGRFERAADLAPDQLHPMLAAGSVSLRLQRWGQSRTWYRRAIRMDSSVEEAHAGMIEACIGLGEYEQAEAEFYMSEWSLEESSPLCLLAMGRGLMEQCTWKRAEWCLREAIRIEPDLPEVRGCLATVLAETGRADQAMDMFNRTLRESPDDSEALLATAKLLMRLRRSSEAIERLEHLLRRDPLHLDAHDLLATISFATGHMDRAIFEYQLVLRLHPSHGPAMLGLAESLLATGRLNDTRMLLKHMMKHRDEICRGGVAKRAPLDRLADLLLATGQNDHALTVADESLERNGSSAERYRRLALAGHRDGQLLRGWAASRRALRIEPGCVRSLHNLVLASLDAGRVDLAGQWLAVGLGLHPRDEGLRRLRVRYWIHRLGRMFIGDRRMRRAQ